MEEDSQARRAMEIYERIRPHLQGEEPAVQGATLAQLLAAWLAGHPNFVREESLHLHMTAVRRLIRWEERRIFNGGEHPQNRHT